MPAKALNVASVAALLGALATFLLTLPSWDALATPQGAGGLLAALLAALGGWLRPQPGRRPYRPAERPLRGTRLP